MHARSYLQAKAIFADQHSCQGAGKRHRISTVQISRDRRSKGLLTLMSKRALGASSDVQGLLQEAPGQSPCLTEMPLWALVGVVRWVDAVGSGLELMGCCWSAEVCSPAEAANQTDLVMHESCSRETVTLYSSSPERVVTVDITARVICWWYTSSSAGNRDFVSCSAAPAYQAKFDNAACCMAVEATPSSTKPLSLQNTVQLLPCRASTSARVAYQRFSE